MFEKMLDLAWYALLRSNLNAS